MVPGKSLNTHYTPQDRARLHAIAEASIRHGFETGRPLRVDLSVEPEKLREHRASFVTLQERGQLRGCIGALEAYQPLAQDVADHAFAAAFQDPRFPPLRPEELDALDIKISVLSPPEPLPAADTASLLRELRPGVDGLILHDGQYKATFLPSVWEQLPDARDFIAALKRKAGLPPDYESPTMRAWRYTTEEF